MEYLVVLLLVLASALFFEWKYRLTLYHTRKERLLITAIFFVVGVAWDHFAVYRAHWLFPGTGLVGIRIGLLPLEEYLFILIIPFWILTIYHALCKHEKIAQKTR